jgi:hypothetical protein
VKEITVELKGVGVNLPTDSTVEVVITLKDGPVITDCKRISLVPPYEKLVIL